MGKMTLESIAGERVVLRPVGQADLPWLHEAAAEPSIAAWWDNGFGAKWVDELLEEEDLYGYIVEMDKAPVGFVQWGEETDPGYRSASIDIFFVPEGQGKGLCTEVLRTLAKWLFEERGHHRLEIDPSTENEKAIRCYQKVGFKPIGVARRRERRTDGTWRDSLLMDLLSDELQ